MLKKVLIVIISIHLLLPLFTGVSGFSTPISNSPPSFQKTCDMDHCYPNLPKCPLCPSSSPIVQYFYSDTGDFLPPLNSSFILISIDILSDQGFVKSIFHPPTSIL